MVRNMPTLDSFSSEHFPPFSVWFATRLEMVWKYVMSPDFRRRGPQRRFPIPTTGVPEARGLTRQIIVWEPRRKIPRIAGRNYFSPGNFPLPKGSSCCLFLRLPNDQIILNTSSGMRCSDTDVRERGRGYPVWHAAYARTDAKWEAGAV